MINKYWIYILLAVIVIYFIKTQESFTELEENNSGDITPFGQVDLPNVPIPKIPLLKKGERYELLDLPFCNERFRASYSSNTNNIVNDGTKIYQNMTKPHDQKAEIGDKLQGLAQISWRKSYFNYNNKPVGLELQFTHVEPGTGKVTKVIFPLSLESNYAKESFSQKESFSNTKSLKKKLKHELQDKSISNIEKLGELNAFLKSPSDVPEKIPGQVNVGQLLSFDLCEPASLMLDQRKFFFASTAKNELLLIAKPQPFNANIGMKILANLNEPEEDLVIPA